MSQPSIIKNQRQITACALEVIEKVKKRRGKPLQPRDRMALKLLTPKNSALIVKNGVRNLGCRQITFDILTEDIGRGSHRLKPSGVHVLNGDKGWWSDNYGNGQFLWNLLLKEEPKEGIARVLQRLFKFKLTGLFGPKADLAVRNNHRTIAMDLDSRLKLWIQRDEGLVETTLRRMVKAQAVYLPHELGLTFPEAEVGRVVLLFGRDKRFGISFSIEKL